jgi:hypothetical protein
MLATSDVRKDACFTYALRRKTMQSLTSVIIRNELPKDMAFSTRKNFQFEQPRNSLEAYKLEYTYYNMTEHGSKSLQHDLKHQHKHTIQ